MVLPVDKTQLKMMELTGKKSVQHVFNSILWDMVSRQGGSITIFGADLKKIPYKCLLKGNWDPATQSMIIRSMIEKNTIIMPSDRLFTG